MAASYSAFSPYHPRRGFAKPWSHQTTCQKRLLQLQRDQLLSRGDSWCRCCFRGYGVCSQRARRDVTTSGKSETREGQERREMERPEGLSCGVQAWTCKRPGWSVAPGLQWINPWIERYTFVDFGNSRRWGCWFYFWVVDRKGSGKAQPITTLRLV